MSAPRTVLETDRLIVICGDARDVLDGTALPPCHLLVSSPPYGAAIDDRDPDYGPDSMDWDDYRRVHGGVLASAWEALADGGRVAWNVAPEVPANPHDATCRRRVDLAHLWKTEMHRLDGFEPRTTISWVTARGFGSAWGSWGSPSAPNLRGGYECVIVGSKGEWKRECPPEWQGWRDPGSEHGAEQDWPELVANVWTGIAPVNEAARRKLGHPVPFPPELAARLIRLSTWPDEWVIDPYAGVGSTGVAAIETGRRAVLIDQSPVYCDRMAARLGQMLDEQPLFGRRGEAA